MRKFDSVTCVKSQFTTWIHTFRVLHRRRHCNLGTCADMMRRSSGIYTYICIYFFFFEKVGSELESKLKFGLGGSSSNSVTYLSANTLKSPIRSPTRIPVRLALLAYAGPMPFFVVPNDLPVLAFSASCNPSTAWWKSNTKWARSDTTNRFSQPSRPFASFLANSSNSPGKWMTTPLPTLLRGRIKKCETMKKMRTTGARYFSGKMLMNSRIVCDVGHIEFVLSQFHFCGALCEGILLTLTQ